MNFHIEEIIRNIAKRELKSEDIALTNLSLGWSGSSVYAAEVKNDASMGKIVIKTGPRQTEPLLLDESDENRVYGTRFSNLAPVHKLLVEKRIKVPQLLAHGVEDNIPYVVMEYLEGDTKVPEVIIAEEIGRLHSITRAYQGWIEMDEPYSRSWKDAFFSALRMQLKTSAKSSVEVSKILPDITVFLETKETQWQDPSHFVLSHTDGFQGIGKQTDEGYTFLGVIDLEDHQFTDQRFVLSGCELLSELWSGKQLSQEFWGIYQGHVSIEESYTRFRSLFQLFYLLNWLPSYYGRRTDDSRMEKYITTAEKLIGDIVNPIAR